MSDASTHLIRCETAASGASPDHAAPSQLTADAKRVVYSVPVPVHVVQHPLVQDALLTLRDSATGPEEFRRIATRISVLLAAEAMRDLPTADRVVQTPLGRRAGPQRHW